MVISSCNIEMIIYGSNSLKDKRRIIKSMTMKLKEKFNISISETGYNDKWNRTLISIVNVSNSQLLGQQIIDKCIEFVNNDYHVEVTDIERCIY